MLAGRDPARAWQWRSARTAPGGLCFGLALAKSGPEHRHKRGKPAWAASTICAAGRPPVRRPGQLLLGVAVVAPLPACGPVSVARLAHRLHRAVAGPAGSSLLVGWLAIGAGAPIALLCSILRRGPSLSAARAVVGVGADPHPLVAVATTAHVANVKGPIAATVVFTAVAIALDGIEPGDAYPAGPGRSDRAH